MAANFFKDILSSLFGGSDPEAIKKRNLKNIAKNLSKTKFRYYKGGSNEVDPSLAKFFYEIYKAVSPAQLMFSSVQKNMLKRIVLDYAMTSEQKQILENLSEENINEASRKMKIKDLEDNVHNALEKFNSGFDSSKIVRIDALYTKFMMFEAFCQFDYFFMLKKFDSTVKERSFTAEPKFQPVNGTYVAEDLKNFVDVAWVLPFDGDWEDLFKMLRAWKSVEPVTLNVWKKILVRLRNLKERHIFEMLIQLVSENPNYRDEYHQKDLTIVDDFLAEIRKNAEKCIEDIKAKQTAGKVDGLLIQIFGTNDVGRLKYYNDTGSAPFERKQLGSFQFSEPLSYLWDFLIEYVKKNVRELSDIVLVRGEWANQQLATPMSEAYHNLLEVAEKISQLDNSVNETVDLGLKMKTHLPRADRDKESRGIIESTLNMVNETAASLIREAGKLLVIYGRNLKMVIEDCVKPHPELIINWKEIDHFAEEQLKPMCIDVYKKIAAMVSLLKEFHIPPAQSE